MTVRARPRKPDLTTRIAAWKRAYDVVLEEIVPPPVRAFSELPFSVRAAPEDRRTAAHVAARLIDGADLEA